MNKTFSGPIKSINDVTISARSDGRISADFGCSRGSAIYRDMDEARLELEGWADDETSRLVSELAGITKMKRWLANQ